MLIYCHAVESFHYKMEKERWMFFYIFFLIVTFVGLSSEQDQVAGSQHVKHDFYDLLLTCSLL